jgi:hypothetical protein
MTPVGWPSARLARLAVALCLLTALLGSAAKEHSYRPKEGYVPDQGTAVRIAEAVLTPIYGQDIVNRQRPFRAVLAKGVWTVTGTIRPGPPGALSFGGVALVMIAKKDARILRVTHGK